MRLIDADAVFESIRFDREAAKVHPQEMCERFERFCDYAEELVKEAPTIDVEPVRHGRWIPTELSRTIGMFIGVECSLCSFEKIGHGYKYCPSCGAKINNDTRDEATEAWNRRTEDENNNLDN